MTHWTKIFGDRNPKTLQEIELQVMEQDLRIYEDELIREMRLAQKQVTANAPSSSG